MDPKKDAPKSLSSESPKPLPFRVGTGYDIHRFAEEPRRLILGGVEIPHHRGLEGHSDADCLTHALADAIFGAMGLRDIGYHFPSSSPACKDMNSQEILKKAVSEAENCGYAVGNVDVTVIAEEPKLGPHVEAMKECLARSLCVGKTEIGVKATTNEQIGDLGRRVGIAVHAVCLLVRKDDL